MSSRPDPVGVAVFDFDRTLSTRDNVVPFLVAVAGRGAVARTLTRSLPDLLRGRRDAVKGRLARELLRGCAAADVEARARAFAGDCVTHHLRRDVVDRAEWHRAAGHMRLIVSASFECYVGPVAAALGFDAALATRLATATDGRLTGDLDGPNVRRAEKVRRLDEWLTHAGLSDRSLTLWAYGDSPGDRELLARADHAVRIGRTLISREPRDPT